MLYIFSAIVLLTLFILVQKSKKKLYFLQSLIVIIICYMAYNCLICYILSLINIPNTLTNLAIINFIISFALILNIIKTRKIQVYKQNKKELITIPIILSIVVMCITTNFNGISKIRYISMDAVQHYKAAREFSESNFLLNKEQENITTSKSHMPMGYVNIGIIFKIMKPYVGVISLYKFYILFEAIVYFLTGMMFYFCLQRIIKTKNQWLIAILFTIVYMIGYPLNSLISGFHYLLIGILYFSTIFYILTNNITLKKIKIQYKIILLLFLNIGLICSYALFAPIIYFIELIYFIKEFIKNRNKKYFIYYLIFTLILTGFIGCHITLYNNIKELGATGIKFDGWIYKNNISNYILFIPFTCYYICKTIRQKKLFCEKSFFIVFMLFFISLAIGTKLKLCSNYYFYKCHYLLWGLLIYASTKGIILFTKQRKIKKYIINLFCTCYVICLVLALNFIKTGIEQEAKNTYNVMEIFTFNNTMMNVDVSFVSKEEIEILKVLDKELKNNWENTQKIIILGTPTQEQWLQALTGYYKETYKNIIKDIKKWNEGEYEYLILLKREQYEEIKERIKIENKVILYENEGGSLILNKDIDNLE